MEKLNNGKFRVTRGTGAKVGVGVGAGANISATWDDKTYGLAAKTDAGVAALFSGGEGYYADNPDEVTNRMKAHRAAVGKDTTFGESGGAGRGWAGACGNRRSRVVAGLARVGRQPAAGSGTLPLRSRHRHHGEAG